MTTVENRVQVPEGQFGRGPWGAEKVEKQKGPAGAGPFSVSLRAA